MKTTIAALIAGPPSALAGAKCKKHHPGKDDDKDKKELTVLPQR